MVHILLATQRPEALHSFVEALCTQPKVHLDRVGSGREALSTAGRASPHLVIIDSELPDFKPLDLVRALLGVNAMVNTAVVSPLSEKQFHEASEGLGVLARLPLSPNTKDAAELLERLQSILGHAG